MIDPLEAVWQAVAALPDDPESFDALTPDERRRAHDLGVRAQDRLVRCLATLVEGMAADGAELIDERGLPPGYRSEGDQVT